MLKCKLRTLQHAKRLLLMLKITFTMEKVIHTLPTLPKVAGMTPISHMIQLATIGPAIQVVNYPQHQATIPGKEQCQPLNYHHTKTL